MLRSVAQVPRTNFHFVDSAVGSTGAEGQDPAAVPLYSLAYALYYNKAMFEEAGIGHQQMHRRLGAASRRG